MILLIDNYDSFVHNLARYFELLGQTTLVRRNDQIDSARIESLGPAAIVLSPGPRDPRDAGCCIDVVRRYWSRIPILGVCLGHQAIASAFGANIVRSARPMHGRTSLIRHEGQGLFRNIPNPVPVGRYHSLMVDPGSVPNGFRVTAQAEDGTIMAIQHETELVIGVQFHPESILTECGFALLRNFLNMANLLAEHHVDVIVGQPKPDRPHFDLRYPHPITF